MSTPFVSSNPPAIGSKVTVSFDRKSGNLIIEADDGTKTQDIYGVALGDAFFEVITTPRGASRCVVSGSFLAVPGSAEGQALQRKILAEAKGPLDFYWSRDKTWPLMRARLAFIGKPRGGFPTSAVVDEML